MTPRFQKIDIISTNTQQTRKRSNYILSTHKKHILLIIITLFWNSISYPCTRVLYAKPNQTVLVGNTMDWHEDMQTNLWIYPQGLKHTGMTSNLSVQWISIYGSIAATAYDKMTTNGMNERGLAAHLLNLPGTDYGFHDQNKKGLSILLWAQFCLDNFETVEEVVNYHRQENIQIVGYTDPTTSQPIALHLAVEDAYGDSAIIEYTNGVIQIFHSKEYTIVTNEPTYDKVLEKLNSDPGPWESTQLPGTTTSSDRFARAMFYTKHLPNPHSTTEAIFNLLSVLENISQPAGIPSPGQTTLSTTLWKAISDLNHRVYYFNSSKNFNMIWVVLDHLNFTPGTAILKLDLSNSNLTGDVTDKFTNYCPPSQT